MKVAMYYNNHDVRLEEITAPQIGPGELLVKVIASGICGSDVLEWYRVKKAPLVLGHEITGEIAEVGKNVKNYKPQGSGLASNSQSHKVGDRVFVSHHVPCNTCYYCLNGQHTVCETLHRTNFFPGGFSEYLAVPALNVDRGVFLLPENVSFEQGTFIEPLACVIRSQRMTGFHIGQSVLILGAGISGLLHLLLARSSGAGNIAITDVHDYRLNLAKDLGAQAAVNAKENIADKLRRLNAGRLADLVIICTSAYSAFMQALECVDKAGTILCFAATEPGVNFPVPVNDFWRKGITIRHSYGAGPLDIIQAIELLQQKNIPVERLITHRLALKETGSGFQLAAGAKDCVKVIIEPQK